MADICRACGVELDGVRPQTLKYLGIKALPDFCGGLCQCCLDQIHPPSDEDGELIRPVNADDVNEFLVRKMREIVHRIEAGRPIARCEALKADWFGGKERCRQYATRQMDGHGLCYWCARGRSEGKYVPLVGDSWHPARAVLIFARSPEELVAGAQREAERWAP